MAEDPIHDVPVGLEPVLQDLGATPRVDPLKRLIAVSYTHLTLPTTPYV